VILKKTPNLEVVVKLGSWSITLFAIVCIIGGLTGYLKADSLPSLIAGVGGGLVLFFCSRAIKKSRSQKAAFLALMLSLAIGTRFTITFLATHALVPHLLMVVLALPACLVAFKVARQGRRASI
jgi:uncharacterized membrane protein (UPF0136 family)